jgi:hypothetical protein
VHLSSAYKRTDAVEMRRARRARSAVAALASASRATPSSGAPSPP